MTTGSTVSPVAAAYRARSRFCHTRPGALSAAKAATLRERPDGTATHPFHRTGSQELRFYSLKSADKSDASRRSRLVVLNCCYGGRTRSYGGHRQDLASTFLKWGASAVVASATPLLDDAAGILGVCLHYPFVSETEPLSRIVVNESSVARSQS